MAEDSVPLARRVRRPSWRDPRLGMGVLLVAGSVALGAWAVDDASATVEVYAARDTLTPGTALDDDALVVLEARPPDGTYVLAADGVPADAVVTRTVGAGELLPAAALGVAADVDVRPVVVPVGAALPTSAAPGARVDLWHAPEPGPGEDAPAPALVATDLELSEIREDDSMLGSVAAAVEVLVPEDEVGAVLAARAAGGDLVVVPVAGGR